MEHESNIGRALQLSQQLQPSSLVPHNLTNAIIPPSPPCSMFHLAYSFLPTQIFDTEYSVYKFYNF